MTHTTEPLVTVVIPFYNGAEHLATAIETVREQSYPQLEVVLVDDGSTDGSGKIAESHADLRTLRHETNRGVAVARNTGVTAAHGEIVTFLDCDDTWPVERLDIIVKAFVDNPEFGYVLGREMMAVEACATVPPWIKPEWLVEPQDASNTPVLAVRRETFDRVGLFNPDLRESEDTEWLLRAAELRIPMTRLPHIVVHRTIRENSLSARAIETRAATFLRLARESVQRRHGDG